MTSPQRLLLWLTVLRQNLRVDLLSLRAVRRQEATNRLLGDRTGAKEQKAGGFQACTTGMIETPNAAGIRMTGLTWHALGCNGPMKPAETQSTLKPTTDEHKGGC